MDRKKLLSLGPKDFRVDYFKAPGNGGQKKNKTMSACRITHIASGISAQCTEHREQSRNKKEAFQRLCDKPEFKQWIKLESLRALGVHKEIEQIVEKQMQNVKIEVKDENGKWVEEDKKN